MNTISIAGIGGAGCHILEHLAGTFPSSFRLIGIDIIMYDPETTLKDMYRFADEVIGNSVKEITSFYSKLHKMDMGRGVVA